MLKNITVAHSPDADDIFMYEAIKFGWVSSEKLLFSNTPSDIQTLNLEALKGTYDTTAISFGLYPLIWEDYALLRTAVSFGNGYGPKLIKKKGLSLKPNFKVALSGEHTTNALLFKIAYPKARVIYKNFLEIESAVLSGEVDAGVLIHESILEFSSELCVEREIWDIWCEFRNDDTLPLPLGGMAVRRSLPLTDAIECERVLTKAVDIANKNKKLLCKMLLERNLVRVDDKKLEIYLNLYANDSSISMDKLQIKALDRLFELGFENGFYPNLIKAEPNFIPTEYLESRNA
ncbi:S-ribosylhomocysteine lyase [Campylobacter hyointestinalis subsp. lawsonii]|uniref:1,4-dihydroxy-6-naphtoate synthase n=1 Tax=Campylobacter hyointestinalis subsp. lawsonii TaxID=91353 RepID=A0AAV6EEK4_CAMHY|nr:MqnA/MqnD/SBP family protein [Campylobacter hyointestinalis]KAB0612386.1 S-ribosylhomocysteine lyase [Campylobacter hyointestinalis subsp. lawsonii]RAZ27781.1 S-ribosylhomocysteine lyase [Campylobacter hyointestinalis subsp. lawsonii]RAZ49165.1 S-ribosylhomocysteine lyase [Campylobacter hyointestinalis subsp. lawsonii]